MPCSDRRALQHSGDLSEATPELDLLDVALQGAEHSASYVGSGEGTLDPPEPPRNLSGLESITCMRFAC